jgi:hydrogenase expression/formation protein HypE
MAHGGGGRLMHELIENVFMNAFRNPALEQRHDGAVLNLGGRRAAFTTDSYVVKPLFFRGGDIGSLAVNGTVNDLAMCGARPLFLSAGFIIEEGLPTETLWRIVQSMRQAASAAHVEVVTGDTKVVDRGKGDGVFINTAGLGVLEHSLDISPAQVRPGDVVLLSGDIGRHGMAILAEREGLAFQSDIESDCAAVAGIVLELLAAGIEIHCMRDLTRGGLATALIEIAQAGRVTIHLEERAIPAMDAVRSLCELLGFDPLYVANEGRFVCVVAPGDADRALAILRAHPLGAQACRIGEVSDKDPGLVTLRSPIGATRIVDMLSGEQLPRIC